MKTLFFLFTFCFCVSAAIVHERDSIVSSSIDTVSKLLLDVCYDNSQTSMPAIVIMHGWCTKKSDIIDSVRYRFAENNCFIIIPSLRGDSGCTGVHDAGAREIYDIKDAFEYAKDNWPTRIDSTNLNIVGYSGGGGNGLSFKAKFPDYCGVIVDYFGPADYGYDGTNGWYNTDAAYQAGINAAVGGTPAAVPKNYRARMSISAIKNMSYGLLRIYHDTTDAQVDFINSVLMKDSASAIGYTNIIANISGTGSATRWVHGYPSDQPSLITAEAVFIPEIVAGTYKNPQLTNSGQFVILGYLETKYFSVFLDTTKSSTFQRVSNNWAKLNYNLSTNAYSIENADTKNATWADITIKNKTAGNYYNIYSGINSCRKLADASGNINFDLPIPTNDTVSWLVSESNSSGVLLYSLIADANSKTTIGAENLYIVNSLQLGLSSEINDVNTYLVGDSFGTVTLNGNTIGDINISKTGTAGVTFGSSGTAGDVTVANGNVWINGGDTIKAGSWTANNSNDSTAQYGTGTAYIQLTGNFTTAADVKFGDNLKIIIPLGTTSTFTLNGNTKIPGIINKGKIIWQ